VAYGIVTRHHGRIEVHSSPGHGSQFTLEFPVGAVPVEASPLVDGRTPTALRVLVVDDEESVLSVLAEMLRGTGHHVSTALGGPAAIEVLREQMFDVVFTDLGMPDVNGWDLASLVKARHPESAVVLVSGWGFQLEQEAAHSRGVDRVMAKPFSFTDVESTLRGLYDSSGRRRAA
jgi:CheY-like chemotaxis protein